MGDRIAITFDGTSWFIRRILVIEHDLENDHMVYRCDEHIGGPFETLGAACAEATKYMMSKIFHDPMAMRKEFNLLNPREVRFICPRCGSVHKR